MEYERPIPGLLRGRCSSRMTRPGEDPDEQLERLVALEWTLMQHSCMRPHEMGSFVGDFVALRLIWTAAPQFPTLAPAAVLMPRRRNATWTLFAIKRFALGLRLGSIFRWLGPSLHAGILSGFSSATTPHFEPRHMSRSVCDQLFCSGLLAVLQAGYRRSDLSLVYPIAGALSLLPSWARSCCWTSNRHRFVGLGLVLIVGGILLVAD